jgi:hypothetical protein
MHIFDAAKFFIVLSAGMLVSSGISMATEPNHVRHEDISAEGSSTPTEHPVVAVKEAPQQQQQSGILSHLEHYLSDSRLVNWLHLNRLNDWQVIKQIFCGMGFSAFAYWVTGDLAISLATLSSFTWSALFEKPLKRTLLAVYAAVIFAKSAICYFQDVSLVRSLQRAFEKLFRGDGFSQKDTFFSKLEDETVEGYVLKAMRDPHGFIDALVVEALKTIRADANYKGKTFQEIVAEMRAEGLYPGDELPQGQYVAGFEELAKLWENLSTNERENAFWAIPERIIVTLSSLQSFFPGIN